MFPPLAVSEEIILTVIAAVRRGDEESRAAIDTLPIAICATDRDGYLTYFNPSFVAFAGRTPVIGRDRWCVSWKLFTEDGSLLPHSECPMAVAIHGRSPVRDIRAIAERPDGSRVTFLTFPTAMTDDSGVAGAINMMIDMSEHDQQTFDQRHGIALSRWYQRVVDRVLSAMPIADVRLLVQEMEATLEPRKDAWLH
jgi:PAS domain S-box-containing protein